MMYLAKKIGDITIDEIAEIIPFVIFGMLVVCGICWLIVKLKDRENDSLPINGMNATVVDIQQTGSNEIAFVVWVMFETEDGNRIRLSCDAKENHIIGDKGYLQWQGTRFVSFTRGLKKEKSLNQNVQINQKTGDMYVTIPDNGVKWKCRCGRTNDSILPRCYYCGQRKPD